MTGPDSRESGGEPRVTGPDSRESGGEPRVTGPGSRESGGEPRVTGPGSRESGGEPGRALPRATGGLSRMRDAWGSARPLVASGWSRLRRGLGSASDPPRAPEPSSEPFVPANPLEATLARALSGEQPLAAALALLRQGHVFVPTEQDESELGEGADLVPVLLTHGGSVVVAVLTSGERLRALLPAVPGIRTGVVVPMSWVLANAKGDVPLLVNPGWTASIVVRPSELAAFSS